MFRGLLFLSINIHASTVKRINPANPGVLERQWLELSEWRDVTDRFQIGRRFQCDVQRQDLHRAVSFHEPARRRAAADRRTNSRAAQCQTSCCWQTKEEEKPAPQLPQSSVSPTRVSERRKQTQASVYLKEGERQNFQVTFFIHSLHSKTFISWYKDN